MITRRSILLAPLALGAVGVLWLAPATARADEVRPGVTCDRNAGLFVSTTCTNTTDTGYTVVETTECAGGDYYMQIGTIAAPGHLDPSVKYDSIFVAANDVANVPTSSCDFDAMRVSYSIAPAPPPVP
ncbi:MAG: hypothetical protein QOF67_1666 [Mycobacterium sp.]|jgi:hypothetical protein|nr:hypothetical protein [Mycobacterium sp.]